MLPEWIAQLPEKARQVAEPFYRAMMASGKDAEQAGKAALAAVAAHFAQIGEEWRTRELDAAQADGQPVLRFRAARQADTSGLLWEAVVIAPGISLSSPPFYWSEEVLAASAEVFMGVDVNAYELTADFFSHLPIPDLGMLQDVKRYLVAKKVGSIEKAWFETGVGIKANIRFLAEQSWLPRTLQQGMEQGQADVLGLSIDSSIKGFEIMAEGTAVIWVTKIVSASSVDVVTRPAAGGKFIRAIMGLQKEERNMDRMKLLALIQAARADLLAGKDQTKLNDDEILVLAQQAMTQKVTTEDDPQKRAAQAAGVTLEQVNTLLANVRTEMEQRAACGRSLDSELAASNLPVPAQARVRAMMENKVFEPAALTAAITAEKNYLASMAAPVFVVGDQGRASVGLGSMDKIQAACDVMFGLCGDDIKSMAGMRRLDGAMVFGDLRAAQAIDMATIPALSGIRELYALLTGDAEVRGIFDRRNLPADLRAAQDLNSGTFAYVLGNTLNRRIVKDYRAIDYGESLLVSTKKPVKDFRTQEAVNIGYFGDLPDVDPETGNYAETALPNDEEATYAIGQKGNILSIHRKVIINDDVSLIQRMYSRRIRAARRTHAKYVWNFFIANTNCSDGTAWFTGGHGNLVTTAMSFAAVLAGYQAMAKMTEMDSGERIGLLDDPSVKPTLVYPIDLLATAESIENDDYYYTSNDLTTKIRNPMKGKVAGKMVSLLTDVTDWGLLLPPSEADMVEMGYLNGREEPEVFLADGPQAEQVFVADKIRHKIRHEYAGTVVDFRSGYKAAVAG